MGQREFAVGTLPGIAGHRGKSSGQPMVTGDDATGSHFFRIPSLLTLQNGWILAASDIRWRTSGDSPANLDTIVSLSKDNGATWEWEVVNYYADMADTANGPESASFIDPAILQSEDGTIHLMVDAFPARAGLARGGRFGYESTGFDSRGRLLVAKGIAGEDAPVERREYSYYVDTDAEGVFYSNDGKPVRVYPICKAACGSVTEIWVDSWLNTYQEAKDVLIPLYCRQLHGTGEVQANLFYLNSSWKAYPTGFTLYRTAEIKDSGLIWSEPRFLNIKYSKTEAFTGVCPGRGLSVCYQGTERLLFALYDNETGLELASVIYSDDGGMTWRRGERQKADALNGAGKTSESQLIALPDGRLRMYSRNLADHISYADSDDGGVTWGVCQMDASLYSKCRNGGCMVSFVNVDGILEGPDGQRYSDLVLASYSRIQRTEGTIRLGSMDMQGNVTWLNADVSRYACGAFEYSCVTQLCASGDFAILYEFGERNSQTSTIVFEPVAVASLLGPGWHLR